MLTQEKSDYVDKNDMEIIKVINSLNQVSDSIMHLKQQLDYALIAANFAKDKLEKQLFPQELECQKEESHDE